MSNMLMFNSFMSFLMCNFGEELSLDVSGYFVHPVKDCPIRTLIFYLWVETPYVSVTLHTLC